MLNTSVTTLIFSVDVLGDTLKHMWWFPVNYESFFCYKKGKCQAHYHFFFLKSLHLSIEWSSTAFFSLIDLLKNILDNVISIVCLTLFRIYI